METGHFPTTPLPRTTRIPLHALLPPRPLPPGHFILLCYNRVCVPWGSAFYKQQVVYSQGNRPARFTRQPQQILFFLRMLRKKKETRYKIYTFGALLAAGNPGSYLAPLR